MLTPLDTLGGQICWACRLRRPLNNNSFNQGQRLLPVISPSASLVIFTPCLALAEVKVNLEVNFNLILSQPEMPSFARVIMALDLGMRQDCGPVCSITWEYESQGALSNSTRKILQLSCSFVIHRHHDNVSAILLLINNQSNFSKPSSPNQASSSHCLWAKCSNTSQAVIRAKGNRSRHFGQCVQPKVVCWPDDKKYLRLQVLSRSKVNQSSTLILSFQRISLKSD